MQAKLKRSRAASPAIGGAPGIFSGAKNKLFTPQIGNRNAKNFFTESQILPNLPRTLGK
jgi:hypothetical protein